MSILFGAPNSKNLTVSEALQAKSINLIRTTPRALQPFVVNTYIQPAYNTYVSLLPAYMRAHIYRKATRATEVGYSIVDYKGPLLPFKPPVLTLSFPGKTPMADFKELMKSAGANELSVKGQTIYVVPKYDASFIKAARNAKCLETSPSPDETVNLSALGPMITIRKIFSIFFKTHGYPMASGPGHLHDLVTLHLVEKPEGPIGGKRTREDDTGGSPSKKHHTELPVVNEDVDIDDVSDTEPEPSSKSSDSIVWALPNTNPRAWGDETSIPSAYGNFLQYVPELADYDNRTVSHTIFKYFSRALGTSKQQILNTIDAIRSAEGVFSTTSLGKEWAHLAKCIDIGLQAQCQIYPIYSNDVYHGCVLAGYGHTIKLYNTIYEPLPHPDLLKLVENSSPHKSTLHAIYSLIGMSVEEMGQVDPNISTIMKLRDVLLNTTMTESVRDEVSKLAKHLRYQQASWPISSNHLVKAFELIHSADPLDDSLPIHPAYIFEKDRVALVWSCFGPIAPTCSFEGGPVVFLDGPSKSLDRMIWRTRPLKEAIQDINHLLSVKSFTAGQGNRRSGAFKDRMFEGAKAKEIVASIMKAAGVVTKGKGKMKEYVEVVEENDIEDLF